MVGILIISHSRKLAEGVKELVDQMVKGEVKIAAVGGVATDPNVLGTDPLRVKEAIESIMDEDGVVILGDFGSALLSAKAAITMLPPDKRRRVVIADAPLVEGAFAAGVEASSGGSLDEVRAAAEEAREMRKVSG